MLEVMMRKLWLALVVLALTHVCASGEQLGEYTAKDPRFTLSTGVGLVIPPSDMEGFYETRAGKMGYLEGTWRIGHTPIDVGVYGNYAVFNRMSATDSLKYDFSVVNVLAVANYNKRVFKHLRFFCGVGIGALDMGTWSVMHKHQDVSEMGSRHRIVLSSMLRFGVDAYNLLRISWGYNMQKTTYRYGFMSVGVTFGGGKAKRKFAAAPSVQ